MTLTPKTRDIDYLFQYELSRRDFLLDTLALGGLTAAGLGWSNNSLAADDGILKIGYLPIADATALLVAHAYGYFEQQGLKVAQPTLVPSWARLIQGFMAGTFNLVHFLNPIPVWLRYNHDIPVKIMSWAHINGSAIIVGKHTHIQSFADLGGQQVAIPYWYSMHNILLQMA
ncbi:MAG: ABC transporter substrate-binding protein, partial [Pseudomonadota bacterium]|nr:ABC transporter substrate-binding protein [Pseudomonadota bacterium]